MNETITRSQLALLVLLNNDNFSSIHAIVLAPKSIIQACYQKGWITNNGRVLPAGRKAIGFSVDQYDGSLLPGRKMEVCCVVGKEERIG